MVALQASDMPIRSKDLPTKHKAQGTMLSSQQVSHAALMQETVSQSTTTTDSTQSKKEDDCLLLDYQNHLFLLEHLNRRASQKTRKPH